MFVYMYLICMLIFTYGWIFKSVYASDLHRAKEKTLLDPVPSSVPFTLARTRKSVYKKDNT